MKTVGGVSASRIVIALSARWLINLALARVLWYDNHWDLVLLLMFALRVAGAGLVSGRINVGATRLIAGTVSGVLLRVIRR